MSGLDGFLATILALAIARGLWRGLVREAFSLAALGALAFVLWRFEAPIADWFRMLSADALPPIGARALAGVSLALGVFTAIAFLQRIVRRSLAAVGLGLFDRLAGGAAGALEGALVAWLVVAGARFALGADHALLAGTRALEIVSRVEATLPPAPASRAARDVAAPAPGRAP